MKRLGLSIGKVKAVFVSHEHTDHIRGLPIFTKKHKIPVYITADTLKFGRLKLEKKLIRSFSAHQPVTIGDLLITPFPKLHDASDPYSFIVDCKKISVGVFTDIGYPCEHVIKHFRNCHAAFLETNYDEQMLEQGNYPYHLKKRIRGGMGHLSNNQALEIFIKHKPAFMSHLILSHLSENNNRPELVQELFNNHAGNVKMTVASRFCETAVFQIDRSNNQEETLNRSVSFSQLSFSFV